MKKLLSLVVVLILAISGAAMAETETKTYVIGATPSPHAELLELIKDDMAELGYPIEIQIFNDYNLPCPALAAGDQVTMDKAATVYGTTRKFSSWVYSAKLYVRAIRGDRISVSTLKSGAITGNVDKKYLTKV